MQVIIDSWKHCQEKKGLEIYGWCIMPSHIHMIIGSKENKLEDIVRDMKSFTSTTIRNTITDHPFLKAEKNACLPVGRDVVDDEKSWQEKW